MNYTYASIIIGLFVGLAFACLGFALGSTAFGFGGLIGALLTAAWEIHKLYRR